jgi:type I site-specific restriction endonuclease
LQSRPLSRPSSSRSLVAVQDEEYVRLHWARKVAKKCEKFEKKKSKKRKKGKSTRELIKENEEMKNEILKYLVKNKQYYKSLHPLRLRPLHQRSLID